MIIRFILIASVIYFSFIASLEASVVMTGTRVIYPGDAKEVSVQFNNKDGFSNVVQLWTDTGTSDSTPETADGPFVVLPTVFKVPAHKGQMVRLVYTGDTLPSDRESVFYLNFLQIPPVNPVITDNKMLVMLRNRVKIFYRPVGLQGKSIELHSKLRFSINRNSLNGQLFLQAHNPTPYYASFSKGLVKLQEREVKISVDMIEPYSTRQWPIDNLIIPKGTPVEFSFSVVSDQGAHIPKTVVIN